MDEIAVDSYVLSTKLWWLIIAVNLGALIYPILGHRGLFADGAHHLLEVLSLEAIHDDQIRQGALYFLDGPTVALVSVFGLKSVKVASWVFNGCLFLMPWMLLLVAARFLPKRRQVLAFFAVLSLILSYFLASLFAVSEVFISSALWWSVLFYIIGDDIKNRNWSTSIGCLIIAVLMIHSYEPLAMCALLLLAIFLFKYLKTRPREDMTRPRIMLPVLFISCALLTTFIVGARWTLFPVDPHREHTLTDWPFLWTLFKTYPVLLCRAVVLVGLLTLLLSSAWSHRKLLSWGIWVVFAAVFLLIGQRMQIDGSMQLNGFMQFEGRLLVPVLVVGFSGAAVLASSRLDRDPSFATSLRAWFAPILICLSVLHVWWQTENTRGWQQYLSALAAEEVYGQATIASKQLTNNAFYWPWAVASLSIVANAINHDLVASVVFDGNVSQPFDPKCPNMWPSLERFGVRYHLDSTDCP